jgi:hypothetical protein
MGIREQKTEFRIQNSEPQTPTVELGTVAPNGEPQTSAATAATSRFVVFLRRFGRGWTGMRSGRTAAASWAKGREKSRTEAVVARDQLV